MSDCITLIGDVTQEELSSWLTVDDMTNVLRTVPMTGVSASGTEYEADTFTVEGVLVSDVKALVLHPCDVENAPINRIQFPALGITQVDANLSITLCGWCDAQDCEVFEESICDPCEDACARFHRLRCCLENLVCEGRKIRVQYRDRMIAFSDNERDRIELRALVDEAKIECNMSRNCGRTNNRRFRRRFYC